MEMESNINMPEWIYRVEPCPHPAEWQPPTRLDDRTNPARPDEAILMESLYRMGQQSTNKVIAVIRDPIALHQMKKLIAEGVV